MPYKNIQQKRSNDRAYSSRADVRARKKAMRPEWAAEKKAKIFNETPEQRVARRAKEREKERQREARMSEDEKEAKRAYRREWFRKNRQRMRDYERARRVGAHPDDVERIRRQQNGCCALCKKQFPPKDNRRVGNQEHIDHDHETGRIRGILCGGCNTALGKLGDNASGLARALGYVSEPAEPDCF